MTGCGHDPADVAPILKAFGVLRKNSDDEVPLDKSTAERCTVSQLVQAVSLPLLVATVGNDRGWFGRADDSRGETRGLINIVRQRYASDDRLETFRQVAGDGTLWLALINTIGGTVWETTTGVIERALTMREVLQCGDLVATAEVGRLGLLVPRLKSISAGTNILDRAARIQTAWMRLASGRAGW